MKRGKYFTISSKTAQGVYICQENSYDGYMKGPKEVEHLHFTGAADSAKAAEAGYVVREITERDLWIYGLWKGSFYRSKGPKA